MLDPRNDLLPQPSSPTNSSISSSDLDTESTGSFFHDRSTTLGTLMGVTFPAVAFRAPSQRRGETPANFSSASANDEAISRFSGGARRRSKAAAERRRRWWSLCRDDDDCGGARPSSLGEFLAVERRFGDGGGGVRVGGGGEFYGGGEVEEMERAERSGGGGRVLFADGRVLPPAVELHEAASSSPSANLCRFPVLLTGICSGCVR